MASICLTSIPLSLSVSMPSSSSSYESPFSSSCCRCSLALTPLFVRRRTVMILNYNSNRRAQRHVVRMAPDEEKLTRRNPLDFPIEWERPKPGRRPDIFPQFSPMKTPLPLPLPYDPPEEDEEEEEKKEEEEEDPEKEEPDKPETSSLWSMEDNFGLYISLDSLFIKLLMSCLWYMLHVETSWKEIMQKNSQSYAP